MGERDRMLVAESYFCERKLKNDFGAAFRYLYTHVFGHCHVKFPYKEIVSFFGHCHVTFPNMEPLSFFGRFVQKVKVSYFSDSFVQKTTQQKGASADGSCNVTSDSQLLYKFFKKTASLFLQKPTKNILCVKNTVLLATMTRCASCPIADITLF